MARFIVTNTTLVDNRLYVAGVIVDDDRDPTEELDSLGAFLFPVGDPTVDAFARLARLRKDRGTPHKDLDTLVAGAVLRTRQPKEIHFQPDYNANFNNYRSRSIATAGTWRFNFFVPKDFTSLQRLVLECIPTLAAGGSGKNIELHGQYGAKGELYNQRSESNTTAIFDLGAGNTHIDVDVSSVFTLLAAGDNAGLLVEHNIVGGTVHYLAIRMEYV